MSQPTESLFASDAVPPGSELELLLEEFVDRLHRGERPDIGEFIAQHPGQAAALERLLPTACAMVDMAVPPHSTVPLATLAEGSVLGQLGDFRLLQELGRGGMGIVYEAEQLSLNRRVALKVLPFAAVLDARRLQRFRNEARAAATLMHPQIVPVYFVGEERGVHFYAMQLIRGQTLSELLRGLREPGNGRPAADRPAVSRSVTGSTVPAARQSTLPDRDRRESDRRLLKWAAEAADALHYAHSLGVVHRDIKPSNLLIDDAGHLWITDFGLALTGTEADLTQTGELLGTLRYMSPEQALGNRGVVDQRSDVYALGMTLFEMLTGQPAWSESDRGALLQHIERDDPPRLRQLRPDLRVELETIVHKAIDKRPEARYQTAAELADDLRRFLQDQPILARPPGRLQRLQRWAWRHRIPVSSLLLTAVICLGTAVVSGTLIIRARHQAELERLGRQADRDVADVVHRNLQQQQYVAGINLADLAIRRGDFDAAHRQLNDLAVVRSSQEQASFEFRYLQQLADCRLQPFGEHAGIVFDVRVSPRGDLFASCGRDGIRIWDATTRQLQKILTEHADAVNHVCFSADGRWLCSTSDDGTAMIRDTQDWAVVARLQHTGQAAAGEFSQDARLLYTGEYREQLRSGEVVEQNMIRVWNTSDWSLNKVLLDHPVRLTAADLSDDSRQCVIGDHAGLVHVCEFPGGAIRHSFQHSAEGEDWAREVQFIELGHVHPWIVTGGWGSAVRFWNLENGTSLATIQTTHARLRTAVLSADDRLLITGGNDTLTGGAVQVRARQPDGTFTLQQSANLPEIIWDMTFLNDREVIISEGPGRLYHWPLASSRLQRLALHKVPDSLSHAAVSPDGHWLACAGQQLEVQALSASSPPVVLARHLSGEAPVEFSPDGRLLVSGDAGRCVVWSAGDWKQLAELPVPDAAARVTRVFFAGAAGERLVCATSGGMHYAWNVSSLTPTNHRSVDENAACSLHGRQRLLIVDRPGVWQLREAGKALWERPWQDVTAAQLSADGTRVAVARSDGSIEVLSAASGDMIGTCVSQTTAATALAFSPDGRTLASCTASGGPIALWHVATARLLLHIDSGLQQVRRLQFTPDGSMLVAAGQNVNGFGEVLLIHATNTNTP